MAVPVEESCQGQAGRAHRGPSDPRKSPGTRVAPEEASQRKPQVPMDGADRTTDRAARFPGRPRGYRRGTTPPRSGDQGAVVRLPNRQVAALMAPPDEPSVARNS